MMLQKAMGKFLTPNGAPLSGLAVFDAASYARSLSIGEVATVRKNLETAWK